MDVWELMSQVCRDEVVVIDNACLLETLETYLRKHRCKKCKFHIRSASLGFLCLKKQIDYLGVFLFTGFALTVKIKC